MSNQNNWGGLRKPGEGKKLGRNPKLTRPVRITAWVSFEQAFWLKGQGEISETIRNLINERMNENG